MRLPREDLLARLLRASHPGLVADPAPALPYLRRLEGPVAAVDFERCRITIASPSDGGRQTCAATREQIDQAIALRQSGTNVVAMCVGGDHPRWLWLCAAGSVPPPPDADARTRRFLEDWPRTLEILSR